MRLSLDEQVELIIKEAVDEAMSHNHTILTSEHVFYVAMRRPTIERLFKSLDINIFQIQKEIEILFLKNYAKTKQAQTRNNIRKSDSYLRLIESAYCSAAKDERNIVGLRDLLIGFIEIELKQSTQFSYKNFININKLRHVLRYDEDSLSDIEIEILSEFYDEDAQIYTEDEISDERENEEKNILPRMTTDLCEQARQNKFDTFIGQEKIMDNIFEALLRRKKNNVILLGDPGVGKTAIIFELANRLVGEKIPKELHGHNLLSLDIISLVAGTRYRGDFENRVKQLIDSLSQKNSNILFLDDIHSVLNAGASAGNSNDFGDLIKPLLVDNVVRCIGTTTHEEFKNFEKDKTLLRRFNIIEMDSPSQSEILQILESIKSRYEQFYGVVYSKKILEDIVNLSKRYINERSFPDKAIDIIDAVGAMLKVKEYNNANVHKEKKIDTKSPIEISTHHVEEIISRISKRPIHTIQKDEFVNLNSLTNRLSKKIFGQEYAVKILSKTIIRSRAGLREETKPIASLLFVGPTGVGKTEISKQLAYELGMHFQRYDMSEFQERHAVSKFIGSPPGYVGHDQGGLLIEGIRRFPNTVLLLDEIEKAHSDIFNLLLQIMDYATITDGTGKKADFRNVIIIMTSNVGAQESVQKVLGFEPSNIKGNLEIKDAVTHLFSPEFRNRLDETIIFSSLTTKHIKFIVLKELQALKSMLKKKRITISWTKDVVTYLVKQGFDPMYGARSVLRIIGEEVKDILSEIIIEKYHEQKTLTLMLSLNKVLNKNIKINLINEYKIEVHDNLIEMI